MTDSDLFGLLGMGDDKCNVYADDAGFHRGASIYGSLEQALNPAPSPYIDDPAGWVKATTGEHLTNAQTLICESVRNNRRTAVHAAHDLGKSFAVARLACWWIDAHPPGEAMIVTTAPTFAQVRAVTWQEIRRTHNAAKAHSNKPMGRLAERDNFPTVNPTTGLAGTLNQTEWWIDDYQVGIGRKPSDHETASFQGFHRRYLLAIIDEASGLSGQLWEDIERILTNKHARVLAIGNPDHQGSTWHQVCQEGSGWKVVHMDGLESPNFTAERVPVEVSDQLLSPVWVDELTAKFGEDSPQYEGMVRGRFPAAKLSSLVPWAWVKACQGSDHTATVGALGTPIELGMDVGETGDETVICERRGSVVGRWWRAQTPDSEQAVDLAVQAIRATGATSIKVDAIGLGYGVVGSLRRRLADAGGRCEVHGVKVSTMADKVVTWLPFDADDSDSQNGQVQFVNLRSQLWWMARIAARERRWDMTFHPEGDGGSIERGVSDAVLNELTAPEYGTTDSASGSVSAGRIKVEPKAETKARLGRSPDNADALLLAFYEPPVIPVATVTDYMGTTKRRARR